MLEEKMTVKTPHNLVLEERKNLSITGVLDIDTFDEESVSVFTEKGALVIKGFNLHINKLSVETGELTLEGDIYSLTYSEDLPKQGGFLARLFR